MISWNTLKFLGFGSMLLCHSSYAQDPVILTVDEATEKILEEKIEESVENEIKKEVEEEVEEQVREYSKKNWLGLNLGIGLSATFDSGNDRRIEDAEIVNGIVRVKDEESSTARILLESHYFFPCDIRYLFTNSSNRDDWKNWFWAQDCGIGPFIAIQPGDNEIVDAAALGLMIGFKYPEWMSRDSTSSFNIGIARIVDPNGKILGDGFVENEAPPNDETEVRFKEKQQYGWALVASFSF